MARLNEDQVRILNGCTFANVATLMPDGGPHATVVWIETDGEYVYFNTAAPGKSRNLKRDKRVAITAVDPENPYRNVQIRGTADLIHEGANEHMNRLSHKYTGRDFEGFQPGETRVTVRVTLEHVRTHE